jgi:hypothetical protein
MKFSRLRSATLVAVLGVLGWATNGRADLAVEFVRTNSTASSNFSDGFSFTTSNTIQVTALDDFSPVAAGNQVRLYNASGLVLAMATVTPSDPTVGSPTSFSSHAITPVTLAAGMYFIAADNYTNQPTNLLVTGLTVASGITYNGEVFTDSLGANPTTDSHGGSFNPGIFGPDFEFNVVATPEPSTLAMLASAVPLGIGWWLRRRKRDA